MSRPKTKSCLDHTNTKNPSNIKTIETTTSDHYTVLLHIQNEVSFLPMHKVFPIMSTHLRISKRPEAMSFFLQDRQLKQIPKDISADEHVVAIRDSKKDCLNRFAPEKKLTLQNNSNQWLPNKLKKAMSRRNHLFQNWINNPTFFNNEHF